MDLAQYHHMEKTLIKSYELKTVTFGINCAPFLAIRTLKQLGSDCEESSPQAAAILKYEIYVDDVLPGGFSLAEAREKLAQLMQTLASASFPFKKITANNRFLLKDIAREDLLGPVNDSPIVTKRQMLSTIARLFDPLGRLSPIVIIAKILMQQLWEANIDWDEAIPPHLLERWKSFRENLPIIQELKIPRWVEFSQDAQVQIHGFCDASEVAPTKKTTIPKLELCGALLLTNLVKAVAESFNNGAELHLWTDSSIVLGWLQKSPQTLKTFVANRVSQIQNFTSVTNWKHVKTEDNPADLGTRGSLPQDLMKSSVWWSGPSWIRTPRNLWPEPRTFDGS
ncbi:uncharacterized protein LOC142224664 [Haematobia irritans]|uniref:uncharacterized protein LOC142224664 n=1 Tax=Haematobia irritans TaxID=7368 RepID=UPI003F50387C